MRRSVGRDFAVCDVQYLTQRGTTWVDKHGVLKLLSGRWFRWQKTIAPLVINNIRICSVRGDFLSCKVHETLSIVVSGADVYLCVFFSLSMPIVDSAKRRERRVISCSRSNEVCDFSPCFTWALVCWSRAPRWLEHRNRYLTDPRLFTPSSGEYSRCSSEWWRAFSSHWRGLQDTSGERIEYSTDLRSATTKMAMHILQIVHHDARNSTGRM